jgi:hypothetical protein
MAYTTTIYRVADKHGRGPYSVGYDDKNQWTQEARKIVMRRVHDNPADYPDMRDDGLKGNHDRYDWCCGFASIDAAYGWFGPEALRQLAELLDPYYLQSFQAPTSKVYHGHSGKQLYFPRSYSIRGKRVSVRMFRGVLTEWAP